MMMQSTPTTPSPATSSASPPPRSALRPLVASGDKLQDLLGAAMCQCEASLAAAKHAADVAADLHERGCPEAQVRTAMAVGWRLAADAMTHVQLAQRLTTIKAALPPGASGQAQASAATILRLAPPLDNTKVFGHEALCHCAMLLCDDDGEEEVCSAFRPSGACQVPR